MLSTTSDVFRNHDACQTRCEINEYRLGARYSPVSCAAQAEHAERAAVEPNRDARADRDGDALQDVRRRRMAGVLHRVAALDGSGVALTAGPATGSRARGGCGGDSAGVRRGRRRRV